MKTTEQNTEQTTEQACSVVITEECRSRLTDLIGRPNLENFQIVDQLYKELGRETADSTQSPVTLECLLKQAVEVALLVADKNVAYGDSFLNCEAFLKLLFPNGITPDKYGAALFVLRIYDKLSRIATSETWGGEDPAKDIAGYASLRMAYLSTKRSADGR